MHESYTKLIYGAQCGPILMGLFANMNACAHHLCNVLYQELLN
jgi:hypothetical protein